MYAVVDIAGQQLKVEENSTYYVPKLDSDVNKAVTFDNILLYSDGKNTTIGTPNVKGVKIKAKVLEHLKDDKVIVFKKKRRKSYKVTRGHRQQLSKIEITNISMSKSSSKKTESAEKAETTEKPKAAAKTKTTAKPKTPEKPKSTEKAAKTAEKSETKKGEENK